MSREPATPEVGPGIVALVELIDVDKRFGAVQALSGVNVQIFPGEIVALVGENGAGKSTLGKVVMGSHSPTNGRVLVAGRAESFRSPRDALDSGITGIAQEISLAPQLTVAENVFLGREPRRAGFLRRRDLRRQFEELDERTHFGIPGDVKVGALALADKQRVEILAAIARQARVIVMDEPTAALSTVESEQLFAVLRSLRAAGTTIVYISHFLKEVLALADRVVVLRDGRVVKTSDARTESADSLITSMLGRSLSNTFPPKQAVTSDAPVRLSVRKMSRGQAFRDIGFDVRAGEIVGLAGLIGAGRTEVARAIFGADPSETGEVVIDGKQLSRRSPKRAMRRGLVYLPESRRDDGLLLGRHGVENVALAHMSRFSHSGVVFHRSERRRSSAMLDSVKASKHAVHTPVGNLSGGNQQKVLFARCLLGQPGVLIVDEPTRGVDVGAKVVIYNLLQELAASGAAVVVISSEHEELIGLAHQVLVMRGGLIVTELTGDDINEERIVFAAMTSGEAS